MRNLSYENEFCTQFLFHANKSHFHKNGFALILALKQRHKGTRKWPIGNGGCRGSMFQALNVINLENVFVSRSTVVLKKDANFFTCFGKLLPFVFYFRHGSTDSFILAVSPL